MNENEQPDFRDGAPSRHTHSWSITLYIPSDWKNKLVRCTVLDCILPLRVNLSLCSNPHLTFRQPRPPGITNWRYYSHFSSRSFSVSSPSVWNSLPAHVRCIDNLCTFKRRLKSHLFQSAFTAYSHSLPAPPIRSSRFWRSINWVVCMYVDSYLVYNTTVRILTNTVNTQTAVRPPDWAVKVLTSAYVYGRGLRAWHNFGDI